MDARGNTIFLDPKRWASAAGGPRGPGLFTLMNIFQTPQPLTAVAYAGVPVSDWWARTMGYEEREAIDSWYSAPYHIGKNGSRGHKDICGSRPISALGSRIAKNAMLIHSNPN